MKRPDALVALAVLAVVTAAFAPASGQTVRTVAVVDFVDETSDGGLIGAVRLSAELSTDLAAVSGGRLRVVPVETVRAAMASRGYGTREIFDTTKMIEIAAAVGADVIVTGRWMHLDTDRITVEDRMGQTLILQAVGGAMIEVRAIEAQSRRVLLADSFSETVLGFSPPSLVLQAARRALRQAAVAIARTVP